MQEKLINTLQNSPLWLGIAVSCILLAGFFFYFYFKNQFSGKLSDIPRELPPQSLSPAVLRYIWRRGFDAQCLLAGILSAVMKDCYRIKWRNESFSIYLNKLATFERLSGDERAALSFNRKSYIERLGIGKKKSRFTTRAEGRMQSYIDENYSHFLFKKHLLILIGLGFSFFISMVLTKSYTDISLDFGTGYFLFVIPLSLGLMGGAIYALKIKNWVALPVCLAFSFVGLVMAYNIESSSESFLFLPLIPLISINSIFFFKLPKRKPEGEKLFIEIEEFRNFLSERVEKDQYFEKSEYYLIPYLVALEIPFKNDEYFNTLISNSPHDIGQLPEFLR